MRAPVRLPSIGIQCYAGRCQRIAERWAGLAGPRIDLGKLAKMSEHCQYTVDHVVVYII